jgi:hypothetical protein
MNSRHPLFLDEDQQNPSRNLIRVNNRHPPSRILPLVQEEDVYAFGFDAGERGGDIYVRGVCGGAHLG